LRAEYADTSPRPSIPRWDKSFLQTGYRSADRRDQAQLREAERQRAVALGQPNEIDPHNESVLLRMRRGA